MTQSRFSAILNLEGNAVEKAAQIEARVKGMNVALAEAARRLRDVAAASLAGGQQRDPRTGRFISDAGGGAPLREGGANQELAANRARLLVQELERLASSGRLSASAMERLSVATRNYALEVPQSRIVLQNLSNELQRNSISLRQNEESLTRNARKMEFMGDVSAKTSRNFRILSSGAQGGMLAMGASAAIMEGNITSLAFSLIFLQFAGNIRVAAGMALLTGSVLIATKAIKGFLATRKEQQQFARTFQAITGNFDASGIAAQRAELAVKRLGLTNSSIGKDLEKGIGQAILGLREQGLEPTQEALKVFVNAFLVARSKTNDFDKVMQSSLGTLAAFARGELITIPGLLGDVTLSMEELEKRGVNAMVNIARRVGASLSGTEKSANDILTAVDLLGIPISDELRKSLEVLGEEAATTANIFTDPSTGLTIRVLDVDKTLSDFKDELRLHVIPEIQRLGTSAEVSSEFIKDKLAGAFIGLGGTITETFTAEGPAITAIRFFIEQLQAAVKKSEELQRALASPISGPRRQGEFFRTSGPDFGTDPVDFSPFLSTTGPGFGIDPRTPVNIGAGSINIDIHDNLFAEDAAQVITSLTGDQLLRGMNSGSNIGFNVSGLGLA